MQLGKKITLSMAMLVCLVMATVPAFADVSKNKAAAKTAGKSKTYTEDEFISVFQGKSRKVISEKLGSPVKKEQSVKPSGADSMLVGKVKSEEKSKPVNVEMWYYKNIVRYDPKRIWERGRNIEQLCIRN